MELELRAQLGEERRVLPRASLERLAHHAAEGAPQQAALVRAVGAEGLVEG